MITEKDIYVSAQMLIKKHGKKAEQYAEAMKQKFIDNDDVKGASVWLRIESALEDLRNVRAQGKLH